MTMNKKMTAIVIAALTITANASDHHDEKKGPKAKPAKVDGKRKLPPHMAKFDKNKDGKLCDAEKATAKAAWVKRFDKDGNGKVEGKELAAAKKAMAERRKNAQKNKGKGKKKPAPKGGKKPAPKKGK